MIRAGLLRRSAWSALACALALAGACAQESTNAPLIGECDAGSKCGMPGGTSGGGVTIVDAGRGDSGACGFIVFRAPVCNACVKTRCCARDAACSDNAACLDIVRCTSGCLPTDTACSTRCQNASPNGVADYQNFLDCTASECGGECAPSDASAACGALMFPTAACDACVNTACCQAALACSNSTTCVALASCASNCPANDSKCMMDCQALYPTANADFSTLSQCVLVSCAMQCP